MSRTISDLASVESIGLQHLDGGCAAWQRPVDIRYVPFGNIFNRTILVLSEVLSPAGNPASHHFFRNQVPGAPSERGISVVREALEEIVGSG